MRKEMRLTDKARRGIRVVTHARDFHEVYWHGHWLGSVNSIKDVPQRVEEDLRELYGIYAHEDDEKLTDDTRKLKRELLDAFEKEQ